jgi:hypothetical protein
MYGGIPMSELRIGARDFAADPLGAKNRARDGATVVITNRGRPDVAMVSYERWKALAAAAPHSALEALGRHSASSVEFQPPRIEDHVQGAEL